MLQRAHGEQRFCAATSKRRESPISYGHARFAGNCEHGSPHLAGIGRDARIAYSSLLGRYLARSYLTRNEGVLAPVPLDVANRLFQGTPYSIHTVPTNNRGLLADWIGLDIFGRLIIAETKGSHGRGKATWRGPSRPQLLNQAERQANRTEVRVGGRVLPVRRWAVASRWGTADKPTPTNRYRVVQRRCGACSPGLQRPCSPTLGLG